MLADRLWPAGSVLRVRMSKSEFARICYYDTNRRARHRAREAGLPDAVCTNEDREGTMPQTFDQGFIEGG